MNRAGAQIHDAAMLVPPLIQPTLRFASRKPSFDEFVFLDLRISDIRSIVAPKITSSTAPVCCDRNVIYLG